MWEQDHIFHFIFSDWIFPFMLYYALKMVSSNIAPKFIIVTVRGIHMHDPLSAGTACCSYLALVAALASEADQVFIPEDPVPNNWVEKLCKRLQQVCWLN